jgi:hypothetical protein
MCGLRRANRPFERVELQLPRDLSMVKWLLSVAQSQSDGNARSVDTTIPDDLRDELTLRGFLVAEADQPGEVPPFGCEICDELLPFVTSENLQIARASVVNASTLELNPRRVHQRGDDVPQELASEVIADESLQSLVGYSLQGAWTGIPARLNRLVRSSRLWVPNLWTGIWQPYEVSQPLEDILEKLERKKVTPSELPESLKILLVLSQILVTRGTLSGDSDPLLDSRLRSTLRDQGFLVIRNIISPLQVAALRRHFRNVQRAGYLDTDREQVLYSRDGVYCEFITLYLQHQFARYLNRILPSRIKPSYGWFFRYRSSAVLERHTDRPQCRWNVSLAIDTEPERGRREAWPLFLQMADRTHSIKLGCGDAVLYSGTETPHWRDALEANQTASLCFLHYVDDDFSGSLA